MCGAEVDAFKRKKGAAGDLVETRHRVQEFVWKLEVPTTARTTTEQNGATHTQQGPRRGARKPFENLGRPSEHDRPGRPKAAWRRPPPARREQEAAHQGGGDAHLAQ